MSLQPAAQYLWHGHALYVGLGQGSTPHQHVAMQIGVSLTEQPLHIRRHTNEPYQAVRGFIVPPNVSHQIDSANIPALFLWTESETVVKRIIQGPMGIDGISTIDEEHVATLVVSIHALIGQPIRCDGTHVV